MFHISEAESVWTLAADDLADDDLIDSDTLLTESEKQKPTPESLKGKINGYYL